MIAEVYRRLSQSTREGIAKQVSPMSSWRYYERDLVEPTTFWTRGAAQVDQI